MRNERSHDVSSELSSNLFGSENVTVFSYLQQSGANSANFSWLTPDWVNPQFLVSIIITYYTVLEITKEYFSF